MNSIKFV